jgi:hypothetical protein
MVDAGDGGGVHWLGGGASARRRYVAAALLVASAAAVVALTARRYSAPACADAQSIDHACFVERYTVLTQSNGPEAALDDLAASRQSNEFLRTICHQLAHVVGRTAGERAGNAAFARGSDLCASGYYHGVVESVMAAIGREQILARATSVCDEQRSADARSYLHYNCVHGMGHGFMGLYDSDVFPSLAGCDALPDVWERNHCYGGVFMENLTALGNASRRSKHLRPSEPLYPCTAVDDRYKPECYIEQTAYALFVRNDDFAAVFNLCRDTADPGFRTVCYEGLGGDAAIKASKYVIGEPARVDAIRRLCLQGPDETARAHCVVGAVTTSIRDTSGNDSRARALCAALRSDGLDDVCESASNAELEAFPAAGTHSH